MGQGARGGQADGPVAQRGAALAVALDAGAPRPRAASAARVCPTPWTRPTSTTSTTSTRTADLDDFDGTHCPLGAHIRRTNPRGSQIVQRSANFTRPIVRRGMPYGPPYDPDRPARRRAAGLLGSFMCASLIAQYEAIMYDWANLGLQDPRVTGTNDPIIGANRPETSRFEIPIEDDDPVVLTGFPRFTTRSARSTCSAPPSARCASSPT